MASSPKVISATTTVQIGQGKLKGIFVSAASTTPTITVYDSEAASTSDPTIISVFTPVAATMYPFDVDGILFKKGLYVVISGTVTATIIFNA